MQAERDTQKAAVERAIRDCIEWPFPVKNRERLVGSCAHDEAFFIFHPDSKSTVVGWDAFRETIDDQFMDEAMKPSRTEIKDLRINLSGAGDVAWYSCLLDDTGEYRGRKWEWLDCRWTGVLEKKDGRWLIVQMHFSLPSDGVTDTQQ